MRWLLRLIALRRFTEGRLRTMLTLVGIAAGVAALIATGAANEAVLKGFRSTLEVVGGEADLSITPAGPSGLPEELAEELLDIEGVDSASPAITVVARLSDGEQLYVLGLDLAAGDESRGFDAFAAGEDLPDPVVFLNDPDAVLVTTRFASGRGLKVGDRFEIGTARGERSLHIRGLIEPTGPAKAFGGQVAIMDIFTAQGAFGREGKVDRVDVRLAAGADPELVQRAIVSAAGPGAKVAPPGQRSASVELMLRSFQVGLYMGSAVSLMVGLFLVFNTVAFAVAQRRREIGTLRAIGVRRREIAALFAIEAAVFGALGSALGVVGGRLLARTAVDWSLRGINKAYIPVKVDDAQVAPETIAVAVFFGIAGAVVASLVPSLEAARVPPVDALRRDRTARDEQAPTLLGRLLGVFVAMLAIPLLMLPLVDGAPVFGYLALAAVVLGAAMSAGTVVEILQKLVARPVATLFGGPGRIALAGMVRARRRSGVAAGAVLIGLALVLCLGTFVGSFRAAISKWIDQAIPADVFIASGATTIGVHNTPMAEEIGERLADIEGVDFVQNVRFVWLESHGMRVGLYGFDFGRYIGHAEPTFTDGDKDTAAAEVVNGAILVSDNMARKTGLRRGDTLELPTPSGPRAFPVAGVVVDYSSDQGVLILDRATFVEAFEDRLVDSFDLYLHPGTDVDAVRLEVQRRLTDVHDLRVASNRELREEIFKILDDMFALMYVLLIIAVMVGVLGVAGTLLAQVLDRIREIGILRATGASKGQIMASVAIEAGLLGTAGAVLGVPTGLLLGGVFVQVVGVQVTGWVFPVEVPWLLAATGAGVAIAFTALGGLLPARRAASLDVVEAISYE